MVCTERTMRDTRIQISPLDQRRMDDCLVKAVVPAMSHRDVHYKACRDETEAGGAGGAHW